MLIILIIVATIAAILFGSIAFLVFRRSRRVLIGTVFAVFSLIFVLADIKLLQARKMSSTPMMMPATTVTSAVVKEEDWAPMLSSVGSISPVQGALVSAELAGVVNKIGFENG